ncbi:MAG: type II toxin-antitoxin system RelE/ParE family toxin [Defluviitaleaceae bacterium]|nr:type II toxin-antitoxin system RelE/ParE family toxin [Defluviitaleaceae bacterium]
MRHKIVIDKAALKFISKQPLKEKNRLLKSIYNLPEGDTIKMSGKHNMFRLRVGSYRVIYSIEEGKLIIRIIEVGNRGDIYK